MIALGDSALAKLFRKLEAGPSLEAELLTVLEGRDVPRVHRRLSIPWPEGGSTDVCLVMERIPDAEDGFVRAGDACASGISFASEAAELGRALRRVHERLANELGLVRPRRCHRGRHDRQARRRMRGVPADQTVPRPGGERLRRPTRTDPAHPTRPR